MMLNDRTIEFFPEGKEVLFSELDAKITKSDALEFLMSENTYVKRKIDGSIYVGHLYHRSRSDETFIILTRNRPPLGFPDPQAYDSIRSPNVLVEYISGRGNVCLRKATLSDVPEIRSYIERYTSPE